MAFDPSVSIYPTPNENGCLMDSDADSFMGIPNTVLNSSWVTKSVGVSTLSIGKNSSITVHNANAMFIPVQLALDKSIYIEFEVNLILELNLTTSSTGTAMFTIGLTDFTGIVPTGVQATITRKVPDDYPLVINADNAITDAGQLSFVIWHTKNTSTTVDAYTYITIKGQITNTNFGFGQLFPVVEVS